MYGVYWRGLQVVLIMDIPTTRPDKLFLFLTAHMSPLYDRHGRTQQNAFYVHTVWTSRH